MKVETGIKSGAFAQDAAQVVGDVAGQVADFITNANQQAADLSNTVINKSTAVWNALVS
ncbi:MAG: hypothetical protein IT297_05430 [Anaerolineae bacterium]|jgi:hypothetical protein|nr:hypothetical protein [Anaerolineae bacterium]MCZ7552486.1 hypothetical protein [Anaerolineales bacterium]